MNTDDEVYGPERKIRLEQAKWTPARQLDLAYHPDGPCVLLVAGDGTRHKYPLTSHETYSFVKRLVGWLAWFHRQPTDNVVALHPTPTPDGAA